MVGKADDRERDAATLSLWQAAEGGKADAIRELIAQPETLAPDWGRRNKHGQTLLMAALQKNFNREVIDALSSGPAALCIGVDGNGDNILHYMVAHADARQFNRLMHAQPDIAGYIDFHGGLTDPRSGTPGYPTRRARHTPLQFAYDIRAGSLIDGMTARSLQTIDERIVEAESFYELDRVIASAEADDVASSNVEHLLPSYVFPFDRDGKPLEKRAGVEYKSSHTPLREAAKSRLIIVEHAIHERQPVLLEKLLRSLPEEDLREARIGLIEAVVRHTDAATVQVIGECFRDRLFEPLIGGETVLHLVARNSDSECFKWLLRQNGHEAALGSIDARGRTPLLSAAALGNGKYLQYLLKRDPAGFTRVDSSGKGVLRTFFEACSETAMQVIRAEPPKSWIDCFTRADKTATLTYAIQNLLCNPKFETPQSSVIHDFEAHLAIIDRLLSQPQQQIDVDAPVPGTGRRIAQILGSKDLHRLVKMANRFLANDHQNRAPYSIKYERGDTLRRLEQHR